MEWSLVEWLVLERCFLERVVVEWSLVEWPVLERSFMERRFLEWPLVERRFLEWPLVERRHLVGRELGLKPRSNSQRTPESAVERALRALLPFKTLPANVRWRPAGLGCANRPDLGSTVGT